MSKQNNLTDFLTDVADAIRQKKGTQAPINPQDFSSEIASIPTGGSNPLQDMLDRSSDTDGSYLFYTDVSANICKQLTNEVLATLDFSNKHYTSAKYMFSGCEGLTTIPQLDFSRVTEASSMFYNCTRLTTIPQLDVSEVTDASNMFYGCTDLTTIPQLDFSKVTSAKYMFYSCTSLTTIPQLDFSRVTSANNMFYSCTRLTTIPQLDFSRVTITGSMFYGCTSLTTLDFSNIKTIGASFAQGASSLSTLIIRNPTTLATLGNANAFSGTPIASGTGYIYVPDGLVDSYKQATKWSTYASQIKGLSELPQGE